VLSAAELAAVVPGAVVRGDAAARFASVSTDSRQVGTDCLFVALRGDRFDGHAFVAEAARRGAAVALVETPADAALTQVVVPNSRRALGLAAAAWRSRFRLPLIAVTGSNGKTTVTQMLACILGRAFGPARRLATRGNLNNDIGLPLMLFELAAGHKAAVLELGMNHPGEIAYLAQLAQPTVALVNNAQREHQEFLGSVEATARENGAAIAALPPEGVAVFPADDPCASIWRNLAGTRRIIDFAQAADATVTAEYTLRPDGTDLEIATPVGLIRTRLAVAGLHNVHNALAASAAALAIDVSAGAIAAGLATFAAVVGRGARSRAAGGAEVIDDTYNANPDSVRAAVDLLAGAASPRILVLGDMGEVGSRGGEYHREVGAYAKSRGIDALLGTGTAMREACAAFGAGAEHFDDVESLTERAAELAGPGATLLVKGSRFMRMERVVSALGATTVGAH
jgi:UDP-N-acetylmuramoyl-tripeptide--D-alanyl-D-alanine ligase